ncbi:MAG: transcriptional regulator [Syntrophus sp. RIFOXYC2_FULL_54_9]|nr:MAG: transcriptional regulator [Syntrophus sp. RIFOXYC2_FULL_54_9]HBB16052.1 transcriptional regulator [Syntrophus sp. (in: bacteria)]
MPEISRFFGIVIKMFFDDHNPPHFHAEYSGDVALIDIRNLSVFSGELPPRVKGFVIEWATIHRQELIDDWERAQTQQDLLNIAPLT